MLVSLEIVNRNSIYTILYLTEGVHIWNNNWLLRVTYNIRLRSDHRFDLRAEVHGQIYLKSIYLMARNTNSSFMFDQGCSYLAQWSLLVSRKQQKFKITNMTLESRSNVFKMCLTALKANSTIINPST